MLSPLWGRWVPLEVIVSQGTGVAVSSEKLCLSPVTPRPLGSGAGSLGSRAGDQGLLSKDISLTLMWGSARSGSLAGRPTPGVTAEVRQKGPELWVGIKFPQSWVAHSRICLCHPDFHGLKLSPPSHLTPLGDEPFSVFVIPCAPSLRTPTQILASSLHFSREIKFFQCLASL